MRSKFLLLFMLLIGGNAFAQVSVDNVFVANDVYSSDLHTRLNRNFSQLQDEANNIRTANIVDDTLTEADMADEINPRIRTYEGAACEFVYTGLLPTTSATLSTTISAGTGYPRGYRCNKASATNKTFTASKDTYVDIDQNCDFQYSEVSNGASAPALATNSIRLAKVTTSGTAVSTVEDMRTTDCTAASFNRVRNDTKQATLANVFQTGRNFASADNSWIQGSRISWDTVTTFKVTSGSAYFPNNNQYRFVSGDTTVTTGNDDPSLGVSGLDTSTIGASTRYYVYLVADRQEVSSYSVTYSTSANAPSGLVNYRKLGEIRTNAASQFPTLGLNTYHNDQRKAFDAWVVFEGSAATIAPLNGIGVTSLTDLGAGNYTVTWENKFANASYGVTTLSNNNVGGSTTFRHAVLQSIASGSATLLVGSAASGAEDQGYVFVGALGDEV